LSFQAYLVDSPGFAGRSIGRSCRFRLSVRTR